jgi:hypothetical protein
MVEDNGEFGLDLIKALAPRADWPPSAKKYKCPNQNCGKIMIACYNPVAGAAIRCLACGGTFMGISWTVGVI